MRKRPAGMASATSGAECRTLVVEGLPDYYSSAQLEHEFSRYGVIISATVEGRDSENKDKGDCSRGRVLFDRPEAMQAAARQHDGKFVKARGRPVGPIRTRIVEEPAATARTTRVKEKTQRASNSQIKNKESKAQASVDQVSNQLKDSWKKISEAAQAAADDGICAFAIISPNACLGTGVKIGPYTRIGRGVVIGEGTVIGSHCSIDPGVSIGKYNKVGNYCWITGDTKIGDKNEFVSHNVVGTRAEDYRHHDNAPTGPVVIGNENVFREYVTIHAPEGERGGDLDGTTLVGNNCYCMRGSHIGHDNRIEDGVTLACNVVLAGYVRVMAGANLGISACVHQYTTIGSFTMIGMGSVVLSDIPPFVMFTSRNGGTGQIEDLNTVGLMRAGRSDIEISQLETWFQDFFRPGFDESWTISDNGQTLWFENSISRFIMHRSTQCRKRPLCVVSETSPLAH